MKYGIDIKCLLVHNSESTSLIIFLDMPEFHCVMIAMSRRSCVCHVSSIEKLTCELVFFVVCVGCDVTNMSELCYYGSCPNDNY